MTCGRSFDRGNNEVYKGGEGGPKLEGKRFEEVTRERFVREKKWASQAELRRSLKLRSR